MSNFIQDLLRDKPPVMVLDMGLGSRLQGFPVHDSEPVEAIAQTTQRQARGHERD